MDKLYIFGLFVAFIVAISAISYFSEQPAGPRTVTYVTSTGHPVIEETGYKASSKPLAPREVFLAGEETSTTSGGMRLTVYNQGFGFINDSRWITMAQGYNRIEFQDVAKEIDPTSVLFTSDIGLSVIEQNYNYDLVSGQKALERCINTSVTVETERSTFTGELLSSSPIVLRTSGGIIYVSDAKSVRCASIQGGFSAKPALFIKVNAPAGNHYAHLSYLTNGITWSADYVAVLDGDDKYLDLSGWVTLDNNAGMTFNDAVLTLVAGEVNRVTSGGNIYKSTDQYMYAAEAAPSAAGSAVTERSFYEYHTYKVNVATTVSDSEQKQILLLDTKGVPVAKEYVFDSEQRYYYYGSSSNEDKVKVMLNFNNSGRLNMALPAGDVRVYKIGSGEEFQFVGEDSIEHTSKDEAVRIFTGYAFDITGKRTETDYQRISDDVTQYTYKIELHNHKATPVQVTVIEHLYGTWTITSSSRPYTKTDSNTIEFKPTIAANSTAIIEYTYLQSY